MARFKLSTLGLALILGCVHVGPVTEIGELATEDTRVYVSSERYDHGTIHRAVVERVSTKPGKCSHSEITRFEYDQDGALLERVQQTRDCKVVTFEVAHEYDPETHSVTTTTYRDSDRDGRFDVVRDLGTRDIAIPHVPPSSVVLAYGGDSLDDLTPVSCDPESEVAVADPR